MTTDSQGPNPPRIPTERPGPAGGKRDLNRRERTRALLDAALALFLEAGISTVTIDSIAREAGVAKGSFYRYFADKRELVAALVAPMGQRLESAFGACREALHAAAGDPSQVFAAYYGLGAVFEELVLQSPDLTRLYLQESRGPAHGAREPIAALAAMVANSAIELTKIAQEHGLIRKVPPSVSALAVVGAGERLLHGHLQGQLESDGSSVAGDLIGIMMVGLRPD